MRRMASLIPYAVRHLLREFADADEKLDNFVIGTDCNGPNLTSVAESLSHPSGFAKPDAAARNACRPDSNTGHLRHHIENGVKV